MADEGGAMKSAKRQKPTRVAGGASGDKRKTMADEDDLVVEPKRQKTRQEVRPAVSPENA